MTCVLATLAEFPKAGGAFQMDGLALARAVERGNAARGTPVAHSHPSLSNVAQFTAYIYTLSARGRRALMTRANAVFWHREEG